MWRHMCPPAKNSRRREDESLSDKVLEDTDTGALNPQRSVIHSVEKLEIQMGLLFNSDSGNSGTAPTGAQPGVFQWMVLATVGVGTFMSALDGSVVNTILPVISSAMQSPIDAVQWVITVYLLVVSGLLLTFGRLGDLHGHKNVYLFGFGIFAVSSGACGFAPTVLLLNVFRGVQAIGAAMLFANAPAILVGNFPSHLRGRVLGIQGSMTYLGLTAGPPLVMVVVAPISGTISDHIGARIPGTVGMLILSVGLFLRHTYNVPCRERCRRFGCTLPCGQYRFFVLRRYRSAGRMGLFSAGGKVGD